MNSVSIIIPTFNESETITQLLAEIQNSLFTIDHEIIVVDDDSPDQTAEIIREFILSKKLNNVYCIHRVWSKGLSSAVIEGVSLASKDLICVMDGDGQHDPIDVLKMLEQFNSDETDLMIGSRFFEINRSAGLSETRNKLSNIGIQCCNFFLKSKLSDPLSGFFLIKRHLILSARSALYKDGFKILLDLMMTQPDLMISERQINFRQRSGGESKLNLSTVFSLIGQIIENLTNGIISAGFLVFSMVGSFGVLLHLLLLSTLLTLEFTFTSANIISTLFAMTSNYLLNNFLTFHNIHDTYQKKLLGLMKYTLANSLSIFANIGIASQLFGNNFSVLSSALIGIFAGLILNYFLSRNIVFKND
jgi:dolichol-phosphate mannosyltransferase